MLKGLTVIGDGMDRLIEFYVNFSKMGALERISQAGLQAEFRVTSKGRELVAKRMQQEGLNVDMPKEYNPPRLHKGGVAVYGSALNVFPLHVHYDWLVQVGGFEKREDGLYVMTPKGLTMTNRQIAEYEAKQSP